MHSTLSTLIGDAEKLAVELTPPSSILGRVVGALALQVEKLANGPLEPLAADVLGTAGSEQVQAQAAAQTSADTAAVATSASNSEVDERIEKLSKQIEALTVAVTAKENAS